MKLFALAAAVLALACAASASSQAVDPFAGYLDTVTGPCRHWTAITPSDTADLTVVPKAIYVGTGGSIAMIGVGAPIGAAGVTWSGVPSASILPVRPRRVLATGTTASFIVACL